MPIHYNRTHQNPFRQGPFSQPPFQGQADPQMVKPLPKLKNKTSKPLRRRKRMPEAI